MQACVYTIIATIVSSSLEQNSSSKESEIKLFMVSGTANSYKFMNNCTFLQKLQKE